MCYFQRAISGRSFFPIDGTQIMLAPANFGPYLLYMDMREITRILTSKAVLLTYVFIGYLAVADRSVPACVIDPVPQYATNDLAFPSAQTYPVAMAEHVRSVKQTPIIDFVETEFFGMWLGLSARHALVCRARPPSHTCLLHYSFPPRAPPSSVS